MNYKKRSWINGITPSIPLTIGHEQVLDIVLKWIIRSVVILGAPAVIIGVIEAFQLNQLYTAGSYSLFYILILITALFRSKLGYKSSAGILLSGFFLIAVLNLINYGFGGAGIPLFYVIFIFSTLFFKLKGGVIAIILSVIPVGIVGWMMISHKLNLTVDLLTISALPVAWVTASALLVFLGGVMIISISIVQKNLIETIALNREHAEEMRTINRKLNRSIEEKTVLLKEVHHRVKNNMAIIFSLLSLQAMSQSDKRIKGLLRSSQNRVKSMALIHEQLYKSEDLNNIDVPCYISELITNLLDSYDYEPESIDVRINVMVLKLELDLLIPLGMLMNEIISNSLEHAYENIEAPELRVELNTDDSGGIVLIISDNGIGFLEEDCLASEESIGCMLIKSLTRQIDGNLNITRNHGTEYRVLFPYETSNSSINFTYQI